ncbi:MAG: SH3 domain-containing protein [Candidatus Nitronauta litoralis]|uniref:SH3 domain-containing protein n=1 Tax=Candidatus Nitronauta litoralis TaxID=2705533 RepID=A0A7T0BYR8_9BACT|nr:MAG: SH3 domain-containing protein [Candidatus Nitronauta litoralis]
MVSGKMKTGRDAEVCSVCHTVIRPSSIFCEGCGPPKLPPEEVNEGIGPWQTFFRVMVVVLIFSGLVFYKYKPESFSSFDTLVTEIKSTIPVLKEELPVADEPDFKLVHMVNVDRANVRARATSNSPVIGVLNKGQVVKMIRKTDTWCEIQLDKRTGWIATRLLDSKVE